MIDDGAEYLGQVHMYDIVAGTWSMYWPTTVDMSKSGLAKKEKKRIETEKVCPIDRV